MKLLIFFITLILLYAWYSESRSDKMIPVMQEQYAYQIYKEMKTRKDIFWVGKVRFSPTKYEDIWLAEIKEEETQ